MTGIPDRIVMRRCPECGVLSSEGEPPMFQHGYECSHDLEEGFDGFEEVVFVRQVERAVSSTVTTTNWGCDCGQQGGVHTPTCRVWSFPP